MSLYLWVPEGALATVELVCPLHRHGRMDGRTFEIEFEVDDVEVELTHGNKIGNVWKGIGLQP